MARHYCNMSKHKIKDKMKMLKFMEYLINTYTSLEGVTVELPVTLPWDGVFNIPNASLREIAMAVEEYYDITDDELEKARTKLGLPDKWPYNELHIASSSFTEVTARIPDSVFNEDRENA